ncbi:helix-turn-helix domain-containing protein [Paenibacillus durus]|uniref:HTH cro/C1-type domain-containing protein n=1 Tax=Paenibacillus durus ATCC 35681 TaxID=1333534 RepID=A0A0F7F9S5_PAEDU|nr:helix-turn-helix domain-containing protein [Paenibacillus durus]AKG34654.1 hypothetical protein VK70_08740 [Paenibacillus durus ATCC 35681]
MDAKEFGLYLKKLRMDKGMTLSQIAGEIGYSNPYISQIENGQKGIPSPDLLKLFSQHFDVSYEELMLRAGHLTFIDWLINTEDSPDYNKALDDAYVKIEREERKGNKTISMPELPVKELSLFVEMPGVTWQGKVLNKLDKARILGMLELLLSEPAKKEME